MSEQQSRKYAVNYLLEFELNWAFICYLQLPASKIGTASFVQLNELNELAINTQ